MKQLLGYRLAPLLLVLLQAVPALAHKVNLFAYAESGIIYTESYFPDGRPVAGGKVLVEDSAGRLLLEGVTDQDGRFNFAIPRIDTLNIVIEASLGHRNSFRLSEAEVEEGQ